MHPQTHGKIERYHITMNNLVKLNNFYLPEQLVDTIGEFVAYYNNECYHESLKNVTPADMYYGRQELTLKQRERIKKETLKRRRQLFLKEKQYF
jgi:putative transposase